MELSDLERRALLGDRQAQDECTTQGILLPCPHCGSKYTQWSQSIRNPKYGGYVCTDCNHGQAPIHPEHAKQIAMRNWNRRPTPPIGRCKDCAHSSPRMIMGNKTYGKVCKIDPYLVHEVSPDGYCDGFKPKEAPNG